MRARTNSVVIWLGNFPEIYDVLNFRWHHEATKKYGNVFQINGMFGVSHVAAE